MIKKIFLFLIVIIGLSSYIGFCDNLENITSHRLRKIYFGNIVPVNANEEEILPIKSNMSKNSIYKLYTQKRIIREKFIHNGQWILKPKKKNKNFADNKLPKDLKSYDVWKMCKKKIDDSDVLFALLTSNSYTAIAEASYAAGTGKIAVYTLPDLMLSSEEMQDLWFILQISLSTKRLWKNSDIEAINKFKEYNINSLDDYMNFVNSIVPNFLKDKISDD